MNCEPLLTNKVCDSQEETHTANFDDDDDKEVTGGERHGYPDGSFSNRPQNIDDECRYK